MADFSSTKKDSSFEEWFEQVESIVELNGYSTTWIDKERAIESFENGDEVTDFFYDNYEADE